MFKLNEAGYDENLDAMTIIQLYKTYGRTTLLYGLENLNLNIGETERIATFEKAIIKKSLKFAPFHHSDHLLNAIKINTMDEKIKVIKMSFIKRLLNNNYTREFTKEILKLYNGTPPSTSILKYALDELNTTDPLNKYLTIFRLKELAELKLDNTIQHYKERFKKDNCAVTIRGLLWNLEENRHLIQVMLEPMGYRFPEEDNLKTSYDDALS